jgi:hypothetical protein
MGQEEAGQSGNTDVLVFHGSTDAPSVDVYEPYAGLRVIDDMAYGEFTGYLPLATADYSLMIQTDDGRTAVAQFGAPLQTLNLDGAALVVVASGFLSPANNNDGEAFGLFVALPSGGALVELPSEDLATARVQVIHNSADAVAATVDVWYNDAALIDDFAFRTASPFIDVTAGVEFDITIQPSNSTDTTNGLWRKSYTLMGDQTYVLIANGIVIPAGYNPAPAFDIYVYAMGQEEAGQSGNTDVLVFHGSTDAPSVDVYEPYAGLRVIDDMAYGEFTGYLPLATADYSLMIQTDDGRTAVAQFGAPLQTLNLDGAALVVVASGFLAPANNNDGEAFGLFVALPAGGALVELPSEDLATARVQVIHNSADAAAATVDVWYNATPLIDDFGFRTASPFIDVTAGVEFDITIQPSNSTDTTNGLWKKSYTLMGDKTYVLIANGIVIPAGYNPAPAFDIYVYDMGQEAATDPSKGDVLVFHGSTDAPVVDIYAAPSIELINNLAYGAFSDGYLSLDIADYIIEVRDETGAVTVASFAAPLQTLNLSGFAITIVASGFLNPADNNDGPAFGLYVALPSGGELVALPPYTTSANDIRMNSDGMNFRIYPNPVTDLINLNYTLDKGGNVDLSIYDLTGKKVFSRSFGYYFEGSHELSFSLDLHEGIYMMVLESGQQRSVEKIRVVR